MSSLKSCHSVFVMSMRQTLAVDKGWAWVVAVACFWTMLTVMSIQRSSGVLFKAMMSTYGIEREKAAWPFFLRKTINMFAGTIVGITNGILSIQSLMTVAITLSTIGLASMFLTDDIFIVTILFGVLYGFGTGVVRISNLITVSRFFNRYRTVALGIVLAGTSTGSFIVPPLAEYLIDIYGLRGSYLLLSGIALQGFIACLVFRNPPNPHPEKDTTQRKNSLPRRPSIAESIRRASFDTAGTILETECPSKRNSVNVERKASLEEVTHHNSCVRFLMALVHIFRFPMFHVIWLTFTVLDYSFYTFLTVVVDHSSDCGVEEHKSVFLLSASSIAELFGRLGGGWVIDLKFLKRKTATTSCFFLLGIVFMVMPFLKSFITLMVLTAIVGLLGSCLIINSSALYTEYIGLENLPLSIGMGATFTGLMSLATPSIIGHIRDTTGSYNLLFNSFGGLLLLSGLLWSMEPLFMKFKPKSCISRKTDDYPVNTKL